MSAHTALAAGIRPLAAPYFVRPLTVGASYLESFECIAPEYFSDVTVITECFHQLDLSDAGWLKAKATLLRKANGVAYWRIEMSERKKPGKAKA